MHQVNYSKFPDNSPVEVRYPRTRQQEQGDRSAWPWLPGSILSQYGPDEWYVCASRSVSWPCCATAGGHRAGPRRATCTTRAVTAIARRSGPRAAGSAVPDAEGGAGR